MRILEWNKFYTPSYKKVWANVRSEDFNTSFKKQQFSLKCCCWANYFNLTI